ncbi:MAG: hypothetical protein SFU99_22615 [Saprospiraceae bacterium]|nr:hypothetical protein [Saprospiraceae bacterium]
MGLFDFFKKSNSERSSNSSIETQIVTAIEVFENNPKADWQGIINQIHKHLNNEDLAFDLYRFIPIAYCRQYLSDMNFPDIYLTADKDGEFTIEHKFSDNELFVMTEQIAKHRFADRTGQDKLMHILRHSSDFNAINQALNDGSQLDDLVILPPRFT